MDTPDRATARSKAEEKFAKAKQQERAFLKERERARQGVDDKIARLRALRLTKEAADRAASEEAEKAKQAAREEAVQRKALLKAAARQANIAKTK